MKILSVADSVAAPLLEPAGNSPPPADIDLILGCGDLPPEYLAALRHRYDAPLYYVLGNHDLRFGHSPPAGCTQLDGMIVRSGGLKITGFSGSRWYNGNTNQYTEQQMAGFIRKMRFALWRSRGVDLIVTHAPPRFVHDAEDPCHKGFRVFHTLIDRYRPRYFIHGHIHAFFNSDDERVTRVNATAVINSYGYHVLEI
ncbi:MAG: metallophosphoesterase family protein [Desulforhopalus sp.]